MINFVERQPLTEMNSNKHIMSSSSSCQITFIHQIQSLIDWINNDAQSLKKEEILDSVKIRVLVMAKKFISYPHCNNFSLMQQPSSTAERAQEAN